MTVGTSARGRKRDSYFKGSRLRSKAEGSSHGSDGVADRKDALPLTFECMFTKAIKNEICRGRVAMLRQH